jgi:hypothetical protein
VEPATGVEAAAGTEPAIVEPAEAMETRTRYPRSRRKLDLVQSLSDPGRMFEFTAIGRVLSTTINYDRFGPTYLLVVGRSERCSLLIALPGQRGSACSHRWRDAGRDTPVYLLDLRRPSDGRRAHWVSAGRECAASAEITSCVYDERPRLPIGLAVGAADQAPRACDRARGLTEKSARSHVSWLRGPRVRIHLPPAESLRTLSLSAGRSIAHGRYAKAKRSSARRAHSAIATRATPVTRSPTAIFVARELSSSPTD